VKEAARLRLRRFTLMSNLSASATPKIVIPTGAARFFFRAEL